MDAAEIDTDVLVIGGGLAALRAAIAARQAGASVVVAVKGKLGRSGCSAMTTAGYAAAIPAQGDSHAAWAADTLRGGARVGDEALIDILCREGEAEIHTLEAVGGTFQSLDGRYRLSPSGDHSRTRVLSTPNNLGTDLTVPLAAHAEAIGVRKCDFTMAIELLVGDGGVAGAVLFDLKSQRRFSVAAAATILATGGAGRLFSVTSNPNDVTGDGFSLAARAGARLRDMEFIQFYPWRCIDPFDKARVSIQPSTFVKGARLYNAAGDRFMLGFNPDGAEISTRDLGARGIYNEMRHGRGFGGGARLDLSPLSPQDFEQSNPKVARYLKTLGLDYATYPFVVTPEAHFWMGGVAIDSHGATSVERLFCAGETAGGVHGANRLNSNALPETQVFGARAGTRAAEIARTGRRPRRATAPRETDRVSASAEGLSAEDLAGRLTTLRAAMWRGLGIIRESGTMQAGLDHALALRQELEACGPGDSALRPWFELRSLCDTAELSLTSALYRRESRGAHYRDDFPSLDDQRWHGNVFVELSERGAVSLSFEARRQHAA